MRAENHRPMMLITASAMAISPTINASSVINGPFLGMTPSSINLRRISGVATTKKASITTVKRKTERYIR